MKEFRACCFIGHRKIEKTKELEKEVYSYLENLIVEENVTSFMFGSRSEFDVLCHSVVTELKKKYSMIERVRYTCKSETVVYENEREKLEKAYSIVLGREVNLLGYEKEYDFNTKYVSGKASYIERNQAMIDDSDFCLFYYNEKYLPPKRANINNKLGYYQPKSGTAIAYRYANSKKKRIHNFYKQ